jgi:hypothetical protein
MDPNVVKINAVHIIIPYSKLNKVSSSHGCEYDVQSCLLGCPAV